MAANYLHNGRQMIICMTAVFNKYTDVRKVVKNNRQKKASQSDLGSSGVQEAACQRQATLKQRSEKVFIIILSSLFAHFIYSIVSVGLPTHKSSKLKKDSGNPDADWTYSIPKPCFPFIRFRYSSGLHGQLVNNCKVYAV